MDSHGVLHRNPSQIGLLWYSKSPCGITRTPCSPCGVRAEYVGECKDLRCEAVNRIMWLEEQHILHVNQNGRASGRTKKKRWQGIIHNIIPRDHVQAHEPRLLSGGFKYRKRAWGRWVFCSSHDICQCVIAVAWSTKPEAIAQAMWMPEYKFQARIHPSTLTIPRIDVSN